MLALLANKDNGGFMERVYKTFTGGYSKEKEGKEATHIILTVDEYDKLLYEIKEMELAKRRAEAKAEIDMRNLENKTKKLIEEKEEVHIKSLEASQNDFEKARREIHRLNDLNVNLSRIMRERANAKRGLKPKKEHNGYLVLDSQQYNYNFHFFTQRGTINYPLPCWKARIQTPYDSSIPFSIIKTDIQNDLFNFLFKDLGVNRYFQNGFLESQSKDKIDNLWNKDDNFVFKMIFKSNYKTGLWEIEFLVRASLTVPENMRTV